MLTSTDPFDPSFMKATPTKDWVVSLSLGEILEFMEAPDLEFTTDALHTIFTAFGLKRWDNEQMLNALLACLIHMLDNFHCEVTGKLKANSDDT